MSPDDGRHCRDGKKHGWTPCDTPASPCAIICRCCSKFSTVIRNTREPETLCGSLDWLASDQLRRAADLIAQWVKAVELC